MIFCYQFDTNLNSILLHCCDAIVSCRIQIHTIFRLTFIKNTHSLNGLRFISFCSYVRSFVRTVACSLAGFIEFTHRTARYTLNEVNTCIHKICVNGKANQFQWEICVFSQWLECFESVLCYCLLLSESFPIYHMDVCVCARMMERKTVRDQNEWGVICVTNRKYSYMIIIIDHDECQYTYRIIYYFKASHL